ncbi:MAG: hypothetical protein IKY91_00790 [Akkermansia sp.]|nr:hypothetical protein [Akkermansia sp.]
MNKHLFLFCGLAAASLLCGCQQKQYRAYFLTESANPQGGAAFNVRYNGRMYNNMPIMSLKHFEKFKSFMADDGSYGVVLYTPKEYRMRLYSETQQNIGKYLLPVVDGLAFPPMEIDCGISDGKLIIWSGLNGYDLRRMSEELEPIDPEIEEKRYLDDNPRPKPELPVNASPEKDEHGRVIPEIFSSATLNTRKNQ